MSSTPNRPNRLTWRIATGGAVAGVMLGGFSFASAFDDSSAPVATDVQLQSADVLGSPTVVTTTVTDSTVLAAHSFAGLLGSVDPTGSSKTTRADAPSVSAPSPASVASVASVDSPASVASPDSVDSPSSVASPDSVDSVDSVASPDSVDSVDSVD